PFGAQLAVRFGPGDDGHECDADRADGFCLRFGTPPEFSGFNSWREEGGMRSFAWLFRRGLVAYTVLFFAFIYLPLVLIAVYSFNSNPVNMMTWEGFTTDWYWQVLGFKTTMSEAAMYIESTGQLLA